MIKLVCFDLDGVLVNACEWHYLAFNKALKNVAGFEISKNEHEITFNGLPTKKKLEFLNMQGKIHRDQFQEIEKQKQFFTIEIINDNAKIDVKKRLLHNYLKLTMGFKLACVTNSIGKTATIMLEKTGQLQDMDLLIHNQKVRYPKPHAEPYIKAMVYLQALPEETIIVEDSQVGLQSAISAGTHIWKVNNSDDVTLDGFKNFYKAFTK